MKSAGGGVYAAEEKILGAELALRKEFSFLTDFPAVPLAAQENLQTP